jgi:hypothetical protein
VTGSSAGGKPTCEAAQAHAGVRDCPEIRVETFLGSSGNLIGAGMPGQLQAFQETCPPHAPNLWTLPAAHADLALTSK